MKRSSRLENEQKIGRLVGNISRLNKEERQRESVYIEKKLTKHQD